MEKGSIIFHYMETTETGRIEGLGQRSKREGEQERTPRGGPSQVPHPLNHDAREGDKDGKTWDACLVLLCWSPHKLLDG